MTSPPARRSRRGLLVTSFITFVLVGAEQSLYGPAFETFGARYGLGAAAVSLTVSLHFLGSFSTILASGMLIRLLGYPRLLAGSALLLSVGVATVGLSVSWPMVLVGAFLAGLGFGSLDVGVNLLVVRSFSERVGPALNVLNAMFGVGAVLGPVLVALTVPRVEWAFLITAGLGLIIAALVWRISPPPPEAPAGPLLSVSLGRAFGFVLIYFLYVSSEVGAASWEATQLTPHFGEVRSASFTSLYWGAITVGRLLAAPVSAVVAPSLMVLGACGVALLAALLAQAVSIAPYAYALMGLAFAPIFPSVLGWLHQSFPRRAEQLAPIALAGATLGPVVTAPLIGLLVGAHGPSVIPSALALLIGAMLTVGLLLRFSGSRSPSR